MIHSLRSARRRRRKSEPIPVWGWWIIGSLLALIAFTWIVLAGGDSTNAFIGSMIFGAFKLLFIIGGIVLYFLPFAQARNTPRQSAILVANIAFGWTVIGWIVVLVWALAEKGTANSRTPKTDPRFHG
jgi:hypothetical protein